MKERILSTQTGRWKLQLDVSGLSIGTYFLRLRTEDAVKPQRLVVVR